MNLDNIKRLVSKHGEQDYEALKLAVKELINYIEQLQEAKSHTECIEKLIEAKSKLEALSDDMHKLKQEVQEVLRDG